MDILPTNVSSFRTASYWNQFYSNPKLENFEWYTDIKNILPIFHKCILERDCLSKNVSKQNFKDSIVVNVGCGNSNLSEVLIEDGFKTVYNLDFSQQVLDEMKAKSNGRGIFLNVDVSKKEYIDFGVMLNKKYPNIPKIIVDKAFMDAFISIDDSESRELIRSRSKAYLENTLNMMNCDDVFIIISVSQDYVVTELIRNMLMKDLFIDIYPLFSESDRKAHMIQFMYSIYKFDKGDKIERKQCKMVDMPNMPCEYFELGQLLKKVKMAKTALYLGPTIKKHTPGRRLAFDIFPSNQSDTCFTVVVYDSKVKNKRENACIIVPAGHEHLWLYSSVEGNQELSESANASRILLIWLKYVKNISNLLKINPLESYSDDQVMEYIKSNLTEALDNFSLDSASGVTIMKVGESCKIRRWVCEVPSRHCGKIIVRDLYNEDRKHNENKLYSRQMIFSSNPQVIQSEITYYEENSNPKFLFNHFNNEYHIAITLSMAFLKSEEAILILGGGAGVLTNILCDFVDNNIEVVELDEAVLEVAEKYFGYSPENVLDLKDSLNSELLNNNSRVLHIKGDALSYARNTPRKYSAVILDINNTEDSMEEKNLKSGTLMSPNPLFLEDEVLNKISELLTENHGILVLNMLTRCKETRKAVLERLEKVFKFIGIMKMETDINEVLICSSYTQNKGVEEISEFGRKLKNVNYSVKDLDSWVNRFSIYSKQF
ncbi:Spermine/spermidine synthase family protein [Theileria parva strain Muguga]|uniref:Spermine/spermidine synthase family protein n=1 Tax=Theileria parva strain Muguga TaxID=333668 RepID=UPI001C62070D|nr:Spermine/spermidine synthase family protein [Theileria parva strain Muguga]KAF5153352.1 Spermine/spermidine synthase family protein [Theileria parva strain Muguga]